MNDISRNLRRASIAVAGFGLGGLIFAAVFARPQLWETPFFLTGWLPIAGVMFYGGIAACRSAPRREPTTRGHQLRPWHVSCACN
ncbi:hypothetical protein BI317_25285 (plasmid) [Xanthomonas hortorum pv. gardneri]|nr:hypothetical protein BI317_25285 [Xanthomonas hortorum pv. gardneri]